MPVINGVYLKDFAALPGAVDDANIIPIAISGNQIAYRTTVSGIITDARITGKLLTGLSVTGTAILATDTILAAFGKVQNQLNNRVSSVGLTMPSAFSVANSPVTTSGTLAVTAAGTASQYIRGDGVLADFPTGGGGGGSSVSYYLNGSVSQGSFGGNTYYEMNKTPVLGAGTDFSIATNGYIAQFLTDANDPNTLLIPAGNFNLEFYFSASSSGGTPSYYVELYKYNGTTFTLIASNSVAPELIAFGTTISSYFSSLAVPETVLTATDRLAIRIYVSNSGKTITLHTEDTHLCQIITTFTTGLQSLNGLSKQAQFFATGSTGTDFAIVSSVDTHTFNIPSASASNRGLLSSANWTTFNNKQDALSGTGIVKSTSGVISYLTDNSTNWNTAYNDTIVSASVTGTTTKTLTLTQQDAGTITASWTDINTDAVSSVFGRTGAVIATSGDYTTAQVTESGNLYYTDVRARSSISAGTGISYNSTTGVITNTITQYTDALARASLSFVAGSGAYNSTTGVITIPTNNNQITNGAGYTTNTGTVTSVGGIAGTGISISGSPITGSGSLTITNTAPDQTVVLTAGAGISTSGTYPNFTIASTITQYTDALARASLSFTAGSGAYNSTTGVITIPTNNNQITNGAGYITSSALSSYLPLAGGTLTGALNGTSATFSGLLISTLGNNTNIFNSVSATTGYQFMRMQNTSGAGYWGLEGSTTNQVTAGDVAYSTTFGTLNATDLHLATDQSARVTVFRSTGNVGIGTTTDAGYKLDVNGTGRFSGALTGTTATFNGSTVNINSDNTYVIPNRSSTAYDGASAYRTAGVNNWLTGLKAGSTAYVIRNLNTSTDNISVDYTTGAATFSSSVTATSLIKSGGTSSQYLMADGSVRTTTSNAYTLKDWYASGNNVSSTETDLMTYTVPANTLLNNGDKLTFTFGGIFGSVGNNKTLRVYFGTSSIQLNTTTETNVGWQITGTIIRDSSTTYRFTIVQTNINNNPYTMSGVSGTVTNYTGTNTFKITGQGTDSADLTAQMGTLQFTPAG